MKDEADIQEKRNTLATLVAAKAAIDQAIQTLTEQLEDKKPMA